MKEVVLRPKNNKYHIPICIRLFDNKKKIYKVEYKNGLYNKELKDNKEIRQLTLLVEALNIKDKTKRLEFIYDKTCELLDDDFYGKNVCEFIDGKCMHDRKYNGLGGGCCCSKDHRKVCSYLTDKGCSVKCLACKFHICDMVRKKGYKYSVNDIFMIKYLFSLKQKIMLYTDFFMNKEESLNNLKKNSLIKWYFSKSKEMINNPKNKN